MSPNMQKLKIKNFEIPTLTSVVQPFNSAQSYFTRPDACPMIDTKELESFASLKAVIDVLLMQG